MAGTIEQRFDVVTAISAFEAGELDADGEIELFQHLLDSGMIYHLQGNYQRAAANMIAAGDIIHA